mmetsp:Transcript_22272/g.28915  ORF Transcript_22272/g.28915 Transcript_22272/m.28915 type:complete len:531 (-) Transcript_22272:52-1644(-)
MHVLRGNKIENESQQAPWDEQNNSIASEELKEKSLQKSESEKIELYSNDMLLASDEEDTPKCIICWSNTKMVDEKIFSCPNHSQQICQECLGAYVTEKINSGNVLPSCMVCVTESCGRPISAAEVEAILRSCSLQSSSSMEEVQLQSPEVAGGGREGFKDGVQLSQGSLFRHASMLLRKYERISARYDPTKFECPQPFCDHISEVPEELIDQKTGYCEKCKVTSCRRCGEIWGKRACKFGNCNPLDSETKKWLKDLKHDARRCPKCRAAIQKNGGCLHITCTNCHYEFMWCCKQKYGAHKASLCPFLRIIKHRHPAFGPVAPIRAITKGTTCTCAVLGGALTGVIIISVGACATVIVAPWYLIRKKRRRWLQTRHNRRILAQIQQTQEQLTAMASMQNYQIDLQQEIQNNIFQDKNTGVRQSSSLDAGLFFTLESGNIEPLMALDFSSRERAVDSAPGSVMDIFENESFTSDDDSNESEENMFSSTQGVEEGPSPNNKEQAEVKKSQAAENDPQQQTKRWPSLFKFMCTS